MRGREMNVCEVSWPKNALTFYRFRIKYYSSMISFYFRLFFNSSWSFLTRALYSFWFSLATKLKFIGVPFRIGCFLTVSCDDGMTKTTNRKERTNECEAEAGSKNKRRNKNFCDNHLLHLLRFWKWFYSLSLCVLIALDRLCTEKCIRTNKPINHVKQKLLLNAIWCKQMKFNDAWCIFIRIRVRIQKHA